MSFQTLNFHNIAGVVEDDQETRQAKFEKYGAYHKTNIVFMLDLTGDMMRGSHLEEKNHGAVPLSYACLLAIRAAIIDMIKHSSLGGGGRDRVAILGLMHNRTVVLLDMQLPSAGTLETVDCLLKTLRNPTSVQGSHMDLEKAFDIAFTFLKDPLGDGQIFICTMNDDPCEKTKNKQGVSEETIVISKTADLTRNHHISIKLLAVPQVDDNGETSFDSTKFWRAVVSDQNSEEQAVIESLPDLAQNIKMLIRPTAITIPNGSKMKLRMKCASDELRKEMLMHVNLYALSSSREFNPSKSFKVDVDDGRFLVEAKVRDGKIAGVPSELFEARLDKPSSLGEDDIGEEDVNEYGSASNTQPAEGTYVKKKGLPFFDEDLKQWTLSELKDIIKHDNPRTVDIVGFIPENAINRKFRGQSPQYMALAKGSDSKAEEWWTTLWHCCRKLDVACLAILYRGEMMSPKQILMSAHPAHRDHHGSVRLPNGFYIHYLPFRERVYVELKPPISTESPMPRQNTMTSLETCLNHISSRSFRPVENKKSERQWKVLEALALHKAPPDFAEPEPVYPKKIMSCITELKAICSSEANAEPSKAKRSRKAAP